MSPAKLAAITLLALQVAWIAHEQLGTSRYFCWAPLHEHVWYQVDARRNGQRMSDREVAKRYGRRGALYIEPYRMFWELNAAQHVLDSIVLRERSLAPSARAEVTVR